MSIKALFLKAAAHTMQGGAASLHARQQMAQPAPPVPRGKKDAKPGCKPCEARGRIHTTQKNLGVKNWYTP